MRRRSSEKILKYPLAALHDGGAVGVGRDGKYADLTQQAAARRPRRKADLAELRAVDVGNAVVPGQPLVEKGVLRIQHFQHGTVFAEDIGQEKLGLAEEC